MYEILKNKKILVGVTGSIAAYKSPLLVRELIKAGAEVKVIMTPSATQFVTPLILSNLSKNPVVVEMFDRFLSDQGAWHILLAHWCDLMIISPCSASTIGKLAHGICDTALVTVAIALQEGTPLLVAPAMDSTMWFHPTTQRNINTIADDGVKIIPPDDGELASGLSGAGRLPEIDVLVSEICDTLNDLSNIHLNSKAYSNSKMNISETNVELPEEENKEYEQQLYEALEIPINTLEDAIEKDSWASELDMTVLKAKIDNNPELSGLLKDKKLLVTAGPTYEKIDDVRFIGNYSSGKMGFAIAATAKSMGADVTLVAGPVALETPEAVYRINVESAKQMRDAVMHEFTDADIIVMAAAVADFTPLNAVKGKIKKTEVNNFTLNLTQTNDILKELGTKKRDNQKLVGFALESVNEIEYGRKKMAEKNCDMVVVNSANKPQSGFGGDNNTITILTKSGKEESFSTMSKELCSQIILQKIAEML